MKIELRVTPDAYFYEELESLIFHILEQEEMNLQKLTQAVNERAGRYNLPYNDFAPPEIAGASRDLIAQRKVEYKGLIYGINYRGVL